MIAALLEHFKTKIYLIVNTFIVFLLSAFNFAHAIPCTPFCAPSSPTSSGSLVTKPLSTKSTISEGFHNSSLKDAPLNPILSNKLFAETSSSKSPLEEMWAKWGTLFALSVSLWVAYYTWRKDQRARRHSIEDDYWLRKVISPLVIEPLLKDILEMITNIPSDCGSADFSAIVTEKYHKDYVEKLAQLATNTTALSLINHQLASQISSMLDNIQEMVIEYCFDNQSIKKYPSGLPISDRSTFQQRAREELIKILQSIKSYQLKLT